MRKYVDELMKRVDNLVKIYEQFIWKEKDRYLIVGFHENKIVSFYLYDCDEVIDEVYLAFDESDNMYYKTICLRTFAVLLGNVKVYSYYDNNGELFYNEAQKPYLAVISKDPEITNLLDELVDNQDKEVINKENRVIRATESKTKRHLPNTFALRQLDERIDVSKELLRSY